MKVVIVGAGVAGMTLAWWLERAGHDVLVLEKAPEFRSGGYMIDFFGPGYDVADRMGILPALDRFRAPISSVTYVDERGEPTSSVGPEAYANIADKVISLLRGDLAQAVYDQVESPVRFGATVSAVDPDGEVRLSDGTVEHADLVVGADGLHSTVRNMVFGNGFVRYLGYHAAAFSTEHADLSDRIGPKYQLFTEPGRMVGCYAAKPGAIAALFLYRNLDSNLPGDARTALRARYGDMGWVTPELLRAIPEEVYFDQVSQVEMPHWHSGRVVLLGDACGAVSLFAGHGSSLAMAGAFVLAQELGRDPSAALVRYEARMRPAVTATQEFGRRFIQWMAPTSRGRIVVRDWVIRLSGLPGVQRVLRGSVMPPVGDLLAG